MADDQITPGERRELRAVVRQQMKVLRAEVGQREAELEAEVEQRLTERYRAEDERAEEFNRRMRDIVSSANKQIEDMAREFADESTGGRWFGRMFVEVPRVHRTNEDRKQLRNAMHAGIKAQVKQALLDLDRREADLLRDLAVDALETGAARAFVENIPTVAELVPSRRLSEIEASFDQPVEGGSR